MGDYLNLSSKIFCLTPPKYFVEETFSAVFQKIAGSEKFYGKEMGRGVSKFSVEKFLSHSAEKFRWGTLLCGVSENFWRRKKLWKRWGRGEFRYFPSKTFCLKRPKSFARETFICLYFWVSKMFMLQRVLSRFSVEMFLSHSTESFRRGTLLCCVSNFQMAKKFMDKKCGGGLSKFSVENFLSRSTQTLVEEPFSAVFQKTAGSEKVYGKKGEAGLSK